MRSFLTRLHILPPQFIAVVRPGSKGRWRWFLYSRSLDLLAMCPVNGYNSSRDALQALHRIVPRHLVHIDSQWLS